MYSIKFMNDNSGNFTADEYKNFFDNLKNISNSVVDDDDDSFEVITADTKAD